MIVAAMRSPTGASAALLHYADQKRIALLSSVPLFVEYEAVCSRLEHRIAAGLSEADLEVFLNALAFLVEPIETHFLWRPRLRDAADEMVLEAAANGRADAIVTFNIRDFQPMTHDFGIEVFRPADAIRRLR